MSKTFLFQAIQLSQTVLIQPIQFNISIGLVYTQLNVKTVPFQTIQFSVSTVSMSRTVLLKKTVLHKYAVYMSKQFYFKQFSLSLVHSLNMEIVLFQVIQFSIIAQFSSIWPIDRTLSGATTPGPSGPGSDGNKGVLHIPQSSSITGISPSDCLMLYPGHLLGGGVLPLCRDVVSVFYSPSQLGNVHLRHLAITSNHQNKTWLSVILKHCVIRYSFYMIKQ